MINKDNRKFANDILGSLSSEGSAKEPYEKPTLAIVKFMFESDITWGSFDDNSNGENSAPGGGDNWWEDD